MKSKLIAVACISVFASCTNDSSDDISPDYVAVQQVAYTNQVLAIISANCYFCHTDPPQNGAPISLTTYDDVKDAVLNHGLIDRISRPQGAEGMMPQGRQRLPESEINIIRQWEEQGFQQ